MNKSFLILIPAADTRTRSVISLVLSNLCQKYNPGKKTFLRHLPDQVKGLEKLLPLAQYLSFQYDVLLFVFVKDLIHLSDML